jgi:hypothetical protein
MTGSDDLPTIRSAQREDLPAICSMLAELSFPSTVAEIETRLTAMLTAAEQS